MGLEDIKKNSHIYGAVQIHKINYEDSNIPKYFRPYLEEMFTWAIICYAYENRLVARLCRINDVRYVILKSGEKISYLGRYAYRGYCYDHKLNICEENCPLKTYTHTGYPPRCGEDTLINFEKNPSPEMALARFEYIRENPPSGVTKLENGEVDRYIRNRIRESKLRKTYFI